MIQTHSNDPDVAAAARQAADAVQRVLQSLPAGATYDYGGHVLHIGEYDVCPRCTAPIAEAQAAEHALREAAEQTQDEAVREHIELAAEYFRLQAESAKIRAELHNGQDSERIVNELLAFTHNRALHDSYDHSHHGGTE